MRVLALAAVLAVLRFPANAEPPASPAELPVRGFSFDVAVEVPGTPEQAYDAFTGETLAFWDHTFSKDPYRLYVDAKPGGGFYEIFDGSGDGARHAVVLTAERGHLLRFEGPLGLAGQAIQLVQTMTFATAGPAKTRVALAARALGTYDDKIPAIVESVWRHFLDEAFRPYMEAKKGGDHPLVAAVKAYRAAKRDHDVAGQKRVLADGARMWFEEKKGEGDPITPGKEGRWKDWDAFFRSETSFRDPRVRPGELRVTVTEINDWYRLVDRPESSYYMTYWFDAGGRISGILVHQIPGLKRPEDRLAVFEEWARAKHPGLLEKLMPDGKLDPALEKARLWKESLREWRAAAGLGDPLEPKPRGDGLPQ